MVCGPTASIAGEEALYLRMKLYLGSEERAAVQRL